MVTSFISLKKNKWWNSNIYFWHIRNIDGNLRDGNLIRRCAEGHLLLRFSWLVKFSLRQRFSAKAALLTDLCTRTCFRIYQQSLHKKWSFPLRISSVNVTKSAASWMDAICSRLSTKRRCLFQVSEWVRKEPITKNI